MTLGSLPAMCNSESSLLFKNWSALVYNTLKELIVLNSLELQGKWIFPLSGRSIIILYHWFRIWIARVGIIWFSHNRNMVRVLRHRYLILAGSRRVMWFSCNGSTMSISIFDSSRGIIGQYSCSELFGTHSVLNNFTISNDQVCFTWIFASFNFFLQLSVSLSFSQGHIRLNV